MRFAIALLVGLLGVTALNGCAIGPPPTIELTDDATGIKRLHDLVGGVECTFDLDKTTKNFVCTNLNDARVELEVTRIDKFMKVMSEPFLGQDDPVVGTISIVDGARYLIEVRIWEDGIDAIACPFSEDMSCFQAFDSNEFSFTRVDRSP